MIAIVDYGMGNLRSVQKALERVGADAHIVDRPEALDSADKVVLPGVGAFRDAIAHLRDMMEVDPQLKAHFQQVRQDAAPDVDIPVHREAAQWEGADLVLNRSPGVGEHNQYVVQEILGLSDEQFVDLMIREILG